MTPMQQVAKLAGALVLSAALAACSPSAQDDLQQWLQTTRQQVTPAVQPLEQASSFKPESYTPLGALAPFDPLRLPGLDHPVSDNQALAESPREPRPLAADPHAMRLVGYFVQGAQQVALVQVGKALHQVQLGSRLGTEGWQVVQLSAHEIGLRKHEQNARGVWVDRVLTLSLQEK